MDKKYQVFVSSTYEDLREERSKVMQALLELNCIPAGMELFPAADDDAWTLICRVIDQCDYYILVVGGRYGSCDKDGISYTEKEYRYAQAKGKRIIAFLHGNPGKITQDKCESDVTQRAKLEQFRALAKAKACKFWNNPDELASVVSRSLVQLIGQYPGIGWIRADQLPADDILSETIRLQMRVRELEEELKSQQEGPPPGSACLAQGDDPITLQFTLTWTGEDNKQVKEQVECETTWNHILRVIARLLLKSPDDNEILSRISEAFTEEFKQHAPKDKYGVTLSPKSNELVRIQFRALGLVIPEYEYHELGHRALGGWSTYRWHLTAYGDRVVTQMLAIRKSSQ